MRQAYPDIEAMGARALAVSVGHAYQARALMDAGSPFPLLVDPDREVVRALGIRRSVGGVLGPRAWWNYLRAIARGSRQGMIPASGVIQMPGLAILCPARLRPQGAPAGRLPAPPSDARTTAYRLGSKRLTDRDGVRGSPIYAPMSLPRREIRSCYGALTR